MFNSVQTLTTKDCKGPQTNMPENVGSIKTWSAKMKSRHIKFCKQNTAMLIVLRENFPVYLHRLDTAGPRLLVHAPIWVEQESYTEDISYPHRKTRRFFCSDLRSWYLSRIIHDHGDSISDLHPGWLPNRGAFQHMPKHVLEKVYSGPPNVR